MADLPDQAELVTRSRQLLEQGLALQSLSDADALLRWDQAVNALVEEVNAALACEGFHSRSLQRHLEWLIDLYQSSLADIAARRDEQATEIADLRRQIIL